jgi:hypothetical protein
MHEKVLPAGKTRGSRQSGNPWHVHSTTGIPKKEVNRILIIMTDAKIKKALEVAGIGDAITCPQAFAIAESAKVSRSEVGEYLTKNRIKIRSCQLGCFK